VDDGGMTTAQKVNPALSCRHCHFSFQINIPAPIAPRRVENLITDKGKVPVYAAGIVEQPCEHYSADDHATWAALYARLAGQDEIAPGVVLPTDRVCSV